MGNVLRFDSKREMDMMAAILIGKGKAIVPRKNVSFRINHDGNFL